MRKTLNVIGCCLVVGGMVLMIGAAGMSDTGAAGLDSVAIQLVTGLVMLGLGSLAARLAQIQKRDNK